MTIKDLKAIKEKYGYDTKMLLLHYTAIAGELPTELIKELGIKSDNQKYILHKSEFKDFFINKRQDNLCGYQLKSTGIDYLINSENIDKYYDYIVNANDNRRKITTSKSKRQRFHNLAFLFYQLDKLGVNYLNFDDNEQTFFLSANKIKQTLYQKEKKAGINNEQFEIKSSRIYGILKTIGYVYSIYIFQNEINQLDYSIELRTKTLIELNYSNENKLSEKGAETIIITKDTNSQLKVVKELFECRYSNKEKYKDKKYKIFKEMIFHQLHILSFDDTGTKQLSYLINKKKTDERIRTVLSKFDKKEKGHKNLGLACDMFLNNYPVEFMYSLDVNKLRYFYDLITEYKYIGGYIVCLKKHHIFLNNLFSEYLKRVKIIDIEDIFVSQ